MTYYTAVFLDTEWTPRGAVVAVREFGAVKPVIQDS